MSMPIIRKRRFNERPFKATANAYHPQLGNYGLKVYNLTIADQQETISQETLFHTIQSLRRRGMLLTNPDVGHGNFMTIRRTYTDDTGNRNVSIPDRPWGDTTYSFRGRILGSDPSAAYFPTFSATDMFADMLRLGATAISRTIPTNPVVGGSAAIGESMERLPAVPGSGLLGKPGNISKKFADEYLNLEFGLKPLISDLRKTHQAMRESEKIIAQLKRDSGRLIRRRYEFPVERSVNIRQTGEGYSYPQMDTLMYAGTGPWSVTRTTEKRTWFSGAYSYLYHEDLGLRGKMQSAEQELNRLFGLRITPELLWELSPWSWVVDWKTNAGDVIANMSALGRDNLVLRWGYVMQTLTITDIHEYTTRPWSGGNIRTRQRFTTTVKRRIHATPYGFGLDPDWKDFSPRQLAILGALGITRGR